ncbi:ABC transporter substrate-binding protein [Streptomyces sp. NBC_00006]|uniref:ABC transporter substrate-binding protein n=1 Tax=unclassified Streptomyces TaxID=2593676 RepID=UPI00225B9DD0|nr:MULTISPECIES: ABC transporter substrate-binding protein [unclassified Streptomyces]MCX4829134.1 ABC transporter substrate-binding protein [Streptomyces sp. NBC_01016]MCX5531516.1 ABC transporter substrate-binding protein [Streptomyces sp. NBC_00006]
MSLSRRNFVIGTSVAIGAGSLLTACSSGNAGGGGKGGAGGATQYTGAKVEVGTADDSKGPAPEVKGARKGGTIYGYSPDDFSHLDPQRIYYAFNSTLALLYARCLTGYKVDSAGHQKLVGDLATDAGTASDGNKTWTFTLKDGLKWDDGSELTVDDVRHGFERGWAPFITEGATFAQIALTGEDAKWRDQYEGPYKGKHLDAIVTDKKQKTITFHLKEARPDFNFTLAMHTYAATPVKLDTKEKYDKNPVSCGPYKIKAHTTDKSMTLVRNKHWDPATDSIRNGYPDGFEFTFGVEGLDSTDRLIADQGNDKYAVSIYKGIPAERMQKILTTPELKQRTFNGLLTGSYYYAINCKRVTDLAVRQALNIAWPLEQIRKIYGGASAGDYASSILSPDIIGYEKYDLYGKLKKPAGDPKRAKELLKKAGKLGTKIVYAYEQDPVYDKTKVVIENALTEAGFKPVMKPIDSTTYYDQVQQVDNNYDVMWFGWSPDWPTAFTMMQPLFDSASIGNGMNNVSQVKVDWIDETIKKNELISDQEKAGKAWSALDRRIMKEVAPIIPETFQRRWYISGSKVGGAMFDPNFSATLLYKTFVKA